MSEWGQLKKGFEQRMNNGGQNKTQTLVVLSRKREARRERRSYLGDVFLFIHPSVSLLLSFSLSVWWFLWKWGHLNIWMVHHTEKALNTRLNHHNFRQNTGNITCKGNGLWVHLYCFVVRFCWAVIYPVHPENLITYYCEHCVVKG